MIPRALLVVFLLCTPALAADGQTRWVDVGHGIHMACDGDARILWATVWDEFVVLPGDCAAGMPLFMLTDMGSGIYAVCRNSSLVLLRPDSGGQVIQLATACNEQTLRKAKWSKMAPSGWWSEFNSICFEETKLYYLPARKGKILIDPEGCRAHFDAKKESKSVTRNP